MLWLHDPTMGQRQLEVTQQFLMRSLTALCANSRMSRMAEAKFGAAFTPIMRPDLLPVVHRIGRHSDVRAQQYEGAF